MSTWPPTSDAVDSFLVDFHKVTGTPATGIYAGPEVYRVDPVHESLSDPTFVKISALSEGRLTITNGVTKRAYGPRRA